MMMMRRRRRATDQYNTRPLAIIQLAPFVINGQALFRLETKFALDQWPILSVRLTHQYSKCHFLPAKFAQKKPLPALTGPNGPACDFVFRLLIKSAGCLSQCCSYWRLLLETASCQESLDLIPKHAQSGSRDTNKL